MVALVRAAADLLGRFTWADLLSETLLEDISSLEYRHGGPSTSKPYKDIWAVSKNLQIILPDSQTFLSLESFKIKFTPSQQIYKTHMSALFILTFYAENLFLYFIKLLFKFAVMLSKIQDA